MVEPCMQLAAVFQIIFQELAALLCSALALIHGLVLRVNRPSVRLMGWHVNPLTIGASVSVNCTQVHPKPQGSGDLAGRLLLAYPCIQDMEGTALPLTSLVSWAVPPLGFIQGLM